MYGLLRCCCAPLLSSVQTWLADGRAFSLLSLTIFCCFFRMDIQQNSIMDSMIEVAGGSGSVSSESAVKLSKEEEDYLDKLLAEKRIAEETGGLECAQKLINSEIERLLSGNGCTKESTSSSSGGGSKRFCDVTKDKPIKVTVRTSVPTRDHPKFNFVGKLLGPKGNSLKRLQEETLTKMAILGRGSMRDKHKEEEYRHSQEPRYKHLNDDLHVEITAYAAPAEAHARIALALTEIRRFLVPDYNDDIRQEQLREMQILQNGPNSGTINSSSNTNNGNSHSGSGQDQDCATSRSSSGNAPPPSVMLAGPLHQHLSAMSAAAAAAAAAAAVGSAGMPGHHHHHPHHHHPLRTAAGLAAAAAAAAAYPPPPPVLPLMHPALRGLCAGGGGGKPSQQQSLPPALGLTAGGVTSAPLLNRFRPAGAAGMLGTTCGTAGLNQQRRPPSIPNRKEDYGPNGDDPATSFLELYHRYNMQPYGSEGSDGLASPDDRDEVGTESDLLASANVDFLDGAAGVVGPLKLTHPSGHHRYRHEPYARHVVYPSSASTTSAAVTTKVIT